MTVRKEIQEIIDAGPLPMWDEPDGTARIQAIARLIEQAPRPVSDEEAQALTLCFGPDEDDALGAAWELLHLIETAPGRMTATYGGNGTAHKEWVQKLNERVAYAADDGAYELEDE